MYFLTNELNNLWSFKVDACIKGKGLSFDLKLVSIQQKRYEKGFPKDSIKFTTQKLLEVETVSHCLAYYSSFHNRFIKKCSCVCKMSELASVSPKPSTDQHVKQWS